MPSRRRSARLPLRNRRTHQHNSGVLVTGASGGIGRAISLAFAEAGWYVGMHYHQNKAAAEATHQAVLEAGGTGDLYQADIRQRHEVQRMVEAYRHRVKSPKVFVCNAGVGGSHLVMRQPVTEWAEVIATNLTGTFHCLCAMAAPLIAEKEGAIVVIGSHAGFHGSTGQGAYAASKAGLIGLVKTAAQEWGSYNVCVNLLLPGWQRTRLSDGVMPDSEGWADHVLHRPPALDEVARTVLHLAQLKNCSGQIWNCDSRSL